MRDLYVVMTVSVIAWAGIFLYLWRLDGRISKLERHQG
jgi:CcmD family protein